MTAFSDYPIPDHYPNYMHNSKMMEYLRMYAKHFGLLKHIQFQVRHETPPTACFMVKAEFALPEPAGAQLHLHFPSMSLSPT